MADRDNEVAKELISSLNMTVTDEFAASCREMFDALIRQGFTEDQSLSFCAKWMAELGLATS